MAATSAGAYAYVHAAVFAPARVFGLAPVYKGRP